MAPACVDLWPSTQPDWIRPGLPAKRRRHESAVYRIYLSLYLSIHLSICLSPIYLYLSIYPSAPASRKTFGACGRREKHPLDRGHGASIVLLGGRSPMRIWSQPRRHPHRNSIQIQGLELMSLSALYGLRELPGNSYPTCDCGLLCTWVPVSTRLLNAHCPSSLQSPS